MKKLLILFATTTFLFWGCENSTEKIPIEPLNSGVIIINEGGYNQNNSSISTYSLEDNTVQNDVYYTVNSTNLGDTGNDLVIVDEKGFIAVTFSNKIEVVTINDFKSVGSIDFEPYGGPREIAISGNLGYATTSNSALVKFDINSLSIIDTLNLGFKPEGITSSDGKLFIAISGWGSGNTITVVDESSFKIVKNITVMENPINIYSIGNVVYSVSTGNYSDGIGALTKIDAKTMNILDTLQIRQNPGRFACSDDEELFIINGNGIVHVSGKDMSIVNPTIISAAIVNNIYYFIYSIGYDSDSELLYLGNPKDFSQNGEIAVFDLNGNEKSRFDVGINPGTIGFK
jgi:hypothetical protein